MEPIATYSETHLLSKRHFELFPDRIRITGKVYLQSDFDLIVNLKNILPHYETIRIREKIFSAGIVIAVTPLFIFAILYGLTKEVLFYPAMGLMLAVGIVISAFTFRKVEYRQFRNSSNVAVMHISRSGKDKHKFDTFIEQFVSCIKECNSADDKG